MNTELTTIRSLIVLLFLIGLPIVAIMPEGVHGALKGFLPESKTETSSTPLPPVRTSDELATFPVLATTAPTQHEKVAVAPATHFAEYDSSELHRPVSQPPLVQPTTWEIPSQVVAQTSEPSPFEQPQTDPIDDLPLPSDRLTVPRIASSGGIINENTTDIQAELDRLGATYIRLESWGNSPRVYRFHCTVTIKIGLAEYSRRFEATADTPEAAMQEVRNEVQAWHDRFSNSDQLDRNVVQPL